MTRTLLCFGDSNTHGSPPMESRVEPYRRYGEDSRWPRVAGAALGAGWTIVEEGLPGRTAQFDDPVMGAWMNGQMGLRIALASHGPIDWLAIMLGTNDCKTRFGGRPETITAGIASLIDIALGSEAQDRHGGFEILLICPPPVEERGCLAGEFLGGAATGRQLAPLYRALAEGRGCRFLDAGKHIGVSPIDGVHLSPESQQTLGRAAASAIRSGN